MSPLFMDTGYNPNSPGSESAEDCHSNTGGSEREGDGRPSSNRGTKRRQKNRDAARKSRRKQTERADELHEELQSLERSNLALEKEIKMLKRDLQLYTITLERHEPHCCLKDSGSSSTSHVIVPTSEAPSRSTSPKTSSQTSCSTLALPQSISSALTSNPSLRGLDSLLPPTTLASSPELFDTCCSPPPPPPYSFPTVPAAHSLFSKDNLTPSPPLDATLICTSRVSNPLPFTHSQPHSGQDIVRQRSSAAANALFQPSNPSVFSASSHAVHSAAPQSLQTSNVMPPYLHLRPPAGGNAGLAAPRFPPHPNTSTPPFAFPLSSFQDPVLQSLPVSPQTNPEHPLAPSSDLKPTQHQQTPLNPTPLLSFLTVPSPINVHQTTSSGFDESSVETSGDVSLSELLEYNDWILNGN